MNFRLLGLKEELVEAVEGLGFDTPMPIQEKAIPALLSDGRDFVGLAQTGTGKTGAFGLPLIQHIDLAIAGPQGIIICPTRELCMQITDDMVKFSKNIQKLGVTAVYGGASIVNQIRRIKTGVHIIVATPGRLLDLINRRVIPLSHVSHLILDEADEMLNMGFKEDIDAILKKMPKEKRTWLFSATMPSGVAAIARNYLVNALEVTVGGKNGGPKNIAHTCYVILEKDRYQALKRIIDFTPDMFGLVFCRTRHETRKVAEALIQDGYQAEALHGELSQNQRDYVMRKFRNGSIRLLVATDVAARGLDVNDITHVLNYNLPDETEAYTHRSGRTARAGKSGESVVFINKKEVYKIRRLEKKRKIRFRFGEIPKGTDICKKQLFGLVDKIVSSDVNIEAIEAYLPEVYKALDEFDKEELINRFISAEFNRFLKYYRKTGDINVKIGNLKATAPVKIKRGSRGRANGKFRLKKTQRFFINFGRLDKINAGAIVRFICKNSGIRSDMIGAINLNREYSFFEVNQSAAGIVNESLNNVRLDGRQVRVRKVFRDKKKRKVA